MRIINLCKGIMLNAFLSVLLGSVLLLSCAKEDKPVAEESVTDTDTVGYEKIHYSVNVNKGKGTKVTIASSGVNEGKYVFEAGDALYVISDGVDAGKVWGRLDIDPGDVGTTSATFSGDIYKEPGFTPYDDLPMKATLVSAGDEIHATSDNKVTATVYPTDAVAPDLATAVSLYSDFTATSTYGEKNYSLSQGSTFVGFKIIAGGLNDDYTIVLSDDNTNPMLSKDDFTVEDGDVLFTIALPGDTELNNPYITIEDGGDVVWIRYFGGASTELDRGKLYTVTDVINLGDIFYSDGTWGDYRNIKSGASYPVSRTPLGLVVYVNEGASSKHPSAITGDDIIAFANGVTEKDNHFGHALVIAKSDCPDTDNGVKWKKDDGKVTDSRFEQYWLRSSPPITNEERNGWMFLSYDGIGKTDFMKSVADAETEYPIVGPINTYASTNPTVHASDWFLPTITQWIACFLGLGNSSSAYVYPLDGMTYYTDEVYDSFDGSKGAAFEMLRNCFDKSGDYDSINGKNYNPYYYWSSTQNLKDRAITVCFYDNGVNSKIGFSHQVKSRTYSGGGKTMNGRSVRAFLAF